MACWLISCTTAGSNKWTASLWCHATATQACCISSSPLGGSRRAERMTYSCFQRNRGRRLMGRLHAPLQRRVSPRWGAHATGHVSARKPAAAAAEAKNKTATAEKGGLGWDDTTEPRGAKCANHAFKFQGNFKFVSLTPTNEHSRIKRWTTLNSWTLSFDKLSNDTKLTKLQMANGFEAERECRRRSV